MRRTFAGLAVALTLALTAASAQAVTLKDIVDLSKAGLGDEVLLALIEVDGGVFNVDADTLSRLKAAGVSEKVIVALVRSGRVRLAPETAPPPPPAMTEPQNPDIVYVQQPPTVVVREVAVPVPVPVYVGVPIGHGGHGRPRTQPGNNLYPSIVAPPLLQGPPHYLTDVPPPPKRQEPVYWGNGGKLRPDAWKPQP